MDTTIIIFSLIFLIGITIAYIIGKNNGAFKRDRYWEKELPNQRKQAITQSRAVLGGQFSEQLSPYLPDFNYSPTECKFIGKPIDFICFKGMDEKNISKVIFIEVKSGKSKVNFQERNLKEAIKNKRVRWEEYRIPEEITENKEKE
jgi:predicted Holliday junction resolvase-like endonuclease